MSQLFSRTLREAPASADSSGYAYLLRCGFIQQLGAGVFTLLPLGLKSIRKIEEIIRSEINDIGGQEILMPVVNPADIWKETGRFYSIDKEMSRFKDRGGRDMVLAMTHEECVTDVARNEIDSYKQLPQLVYQIQTKWRDDPRPRAGLIRVREFTMKDSYSFDRDQEGLEIQYNNHYRAYFNIFNRCGLPAIAVGSDSGMMGGKIAHEYMYLSPVGEDTIITCSDCDYTANRQVATFKKEYFPQEALPMEKVHTPECKTIEELAQFLNIKPNQTAKALFMMGTFIDDTTGEEEEKLIIGVIRGDMEIEENKLQHASKANSLRIAHVDEITAMKMQPGYGSPIGADPSVVVVVDDSVAKGNNLVAGANVEQYHYINTNFGRDYSGIVADIASASAGYLCPECGHPLTVSKGVEVGNIFQLGTRYSQAMGCTYQDEQGVRQPVVMGSYGIGVGRLLACLAEEHHDDKGLTLPITTAPYDVHFVSLMKDKEVSDSIYKELQSAGIEVLYDDRKESAGVKFADADLIGIPVRLTLGNRGFKEGNIELKYRNSLETTHTFPLEGIVDQIETIVRELKKEYICK
jgi:prolyl-tRNA synthetase